MKHKAKPRKTAPWKKLENQLDDLWAKAVKKRDGYTCQRCHKVMPDNRWLHASHLVAKSRSKALRWEMVNGMAKCGTCHNWWHRNPLEAREWLVQVRGEEFAQHLVVAAREPYKRNIDWLEHKLAELQAFLELP